MTPRFEGRSLVPSRVVMGVGAVMVVLSAEPALAQCAMCAQAAAASPVETREALNYAILGMAMAPYAVAAVAAWAAFPTLREHVLVRLRLRAHPRESRDQP